jgi:hypothetical protein
MIARFAALLLLAALIPSAAHILILPLTRFIP